MREHELGHFSAGVKAISLSRDRRVEWEKTWGGTVEHFDLDGGEGETWTEAEQAVGAGEATTDAGTCSRNGLSHGPRTQGAVAGECWILHSDSCCQTLSSSCRCSRRAPRNCRILI